MSPAEKAIWVELSCGHVTRRKPSNLKRTTRCFSCGRETTPDKWKEVEGKPR